MNIYYDYLQNPMKFVPVYGLKKRILRVFGILATILDFVIEIKSAPG